jgi:hypothetical protein
MMFIVWGDIINRLMIAVIVIVIDPFSDPPRQFRRGIVEVRKNEVFY